MSKINGDDVVVHAGDQVITLEERLDGMQKSIKRLTWALVLLIFLTILNLILGPERFWEIVNQLLNLIS